MKKQLTLALFSILLLGPAWSVRAADPTLVGWWWLDDGVGTTATDSSGYGNNGTLMNGPTWAVGKFGKAVLFDGVDDYIDVPNKPILCVATEVTVMAWVNLNRWEYPGAGYQGIIAKGNTVRSYSLYTTSAGVLHFSVTDLTTNAYVGPTSSSTVPLNQWAHVCAMVKGGAQAFFINGVAAGTANSGIKLPGTTDTGDVLIGRSAEGVNRSLGGMVDDARIYNRGLTQAEIQKIMTGADLVSGRAVTPSPSDGQTDVPQDATLNWTAGPYAATHDVYLGAAATDVNSATRAKPAGVVLSQGQTATTYTPTVPLNYGQTYYWRVDEVNKAPDNTIIKGTVWSFTVEPYSYPIPGASITATASSAQASMGAQNTVNGSGLTGDLHGTDGTTMWLSTGTPPNWIQYQFDKVYKLDRLLVWNSNQLIETFLGFGAKDVTVEYSTDGTTWTALTGVPQFARAPGAAGYAANTTVSFSGVMAKYVKLTITSNWGGLGTITGLSEVRFSYVPVQARAPQPANAATGQGVTTTMNWRPGRDVTSQKVYFGTDPNAVANGTVAAKTVATHAFDPGTLLFGTKYYWRVDEVGATTTYPGDVWSFTTQEFAVVDDFESYNDDKNRIYDTWIDGLTDGKSGSTVGYLAAPFAETTIIHGGKQSMPMAYDNSKSPFYSEATRTFAPVQDWTGGGADTLVLYVQGRVPGFLAGAGGTYAMGSSGTDIWNTADQFRFAFQSLTGNGTIVAKVLDITNSAADVWGKAGVMIRESLAVGSRFAAVYATTGSGVRYQARLAADVAAVSDTAVITPEQTALKAPVWVKIERIGSTFNGYYSLDGVKWTAMSWNPQTLNMTAATVYIGLAVTGHGATETTTADFSNVATTGNVTGSWQAQSIGLTQPSNDPGQLYVTVLDSTGKSKVVNYPDLTATTTGTWQAWRIPLSQFTAAGVKMSSVKQLVIGVGNRTSPTAGGAGTVFIDDIGFGHPIK